MSAIITWLIRTIGIGGVAFLGLWIYDWGIPGASRIPYLSSIPIIGDLTTGRAHSFAADQVKLATAAQTAIYSARIEKMVSAAELVAANAALARERSLRRMADEAAAEADKRALDAKRGEEAKAAEIERLRAEADRDAELSRPNDKGQVMVTKALAVILMAAALTACQSTDEKADARLQSAAVTRGQAAAQIPPIVPIAACITHMERVQLRDEPWVIYKFRWEVAADNRDKQADDCAAWIADLNRRNATVK